MAEARDSIPESEVDQALAEYLSRVDSGGAPDRQHFLNQYSPELRNQLSELLSTADLLEKITLRSGADESKLGVSHVFGPEAELSSTRELSADQPLMESGSASFIVDSSDSVSGVDPLSDTQSFVGSKLSSKSPAKSDESLQSKLPMIFGDYELLRVLGRGGMGVVYYARQIQLDRPVAIKMIRSGALATDEEVIRFYTEARSAAKLNHPRIVTVYQCGEQDGHHYFSMDYIEGKDLDKLMREKQMEGKRAARYVKDAAEAIHFAHENGILHRDLKPANVLVDKNDDVHITDFGLAKTVGKENGLTATGAALGTPSFMSPEQAAGNNDEQTQATDVYSLGAVLYTILTGQPPFKAESALQTLLHVIHRPAPRLRAIRSDAPEDLETIVELCLQKSPDKRYASASDLAADLNRFLKGIPISARPISKWRRAVHWVLGIPVVGAMFDNRVIEPSATHRWAQRGLVTAAGLMVFAFLLLRLPYNAWFANRMPSVVRFAVGPEGGQYERIANALADTLSGRSGSRVERFATQGSNDNIAHLSRRQADLTILQADVIDDFEVAVVAPLFHEAIHVLRRADEPLASLKELAGKRVYLGTDMAGSRASAVRLLEFCGVPVDQLDVISKEEWEASAASISQSPVDAAILVTRVGASEVERLLAAGTFELMSLPNSEEFASVEPSFRAMHVWPNDYPQSMIQPHGVSTVATAAFLVCTKDANEVLIHKTLNALYSPEVLSLGIHWTAEEAAHWKGIAWHPAAREFFRAYRGSPEVR